MTFPDPKLFLREPWRSPLSEHHYSDAAIPKARTYFEAFKGREPSDIFAAANGAWNSIAFVRKWFASGRHPEWPPRTYQVLPLVVFEGDMFVAKVTQDGDWDVSPVQHVLLRTIDCVTSETTSPFPDNEIVIDIIHKDALPAFLKRAEDEIDALMLHLEALHRGGGANPPSSAG